MTSKGLRPFRERKVKQSYDTKEGYGQVYKHIVAKLINQLVYDRSKQLSNNVEQMTNYYTPKDPHK